MKIQSSKSTSKTTRRKVCGNTKHKAADIKAAIVVVNGIKARIAELRNDLKAAMAELSAKGLIPSEWHLD